MSDKKYLSMLGLARRAGKLSMGHDMAMKSLREKKATLLLFSSDMSQRVMREFDVAREKFYPSLDVKILPEQIDQLFSALGYRAGVITVDDENFSKRILELINQEENEYGNQN